MATSTFERNISLLDFSIKKKKKEGGVVLTKDLHQKFDSLSPQEIFSLETALKFNADAVYFRYFDDGRDSYAQLYIYDNTNNKLSDDDIVVIHKNIWSGCIVPVYLLIEATEVKIFDSRKGVEAIGDTLYTSHFKTITLAANAVQDFTATSFDTGLFWEESENLGRFQYATSAYKELVDGLKRVYIDFQEKSGLTSHVALKLLVQCLLIKYLEERDEEKESGYFARSFFKTNFNCTSFCEVISSGQLLNLLDKLSIHFNGKIFEWSKDEEKSERDAISKAKVKKLAYYLDGNIIDEQFVIWRLYSFSHLPVELISSVYEELLGEGKKDVVYTPDVVVSTLIDECMPLKVPVQNFKLIDVSCGSGIFLVKAYKRLIQWWRYTNWLNTGKFEKPDIKDLKEILLNSIYGVDIERDAVSLSVFSLALALLDELDPKTIWGKLKFENLGKKNIIAVDFFQFITEGKSKDFDLVIGNPPFNIPGKQKSKEYYKHLENEYNYKCDIKIPDNHLALTFLYEANKLLKNNGTLCLIQPAGPLLYQNETTFKNEIFGKNNLLQIIDFSKLSDVLWGKANVATVAVFIQNCQSDGKPIAHVIASRTIPNVKRLFLDLDHYDFHFINKSVAITNKYIWKANSIGGGRIVNLIEKLAGYGTLGDFLHSQEENGWVIGEGFIEKGEKSVAADFITSKKHLPNDALIENEINWRNVHKCQIQKFHRPKDKKLYSPPHLLIKENIGIKKLSVVLSDEYLTFRANIIGIHAPEKDRPKLKKIKKYFDTYNDLLRFYIRATSSQLSISKATVPLKEDFMNLPYPPDGSIVISKVDSILIEEVLKYQFSGDSKSSIKQNASQNDLENFSDIFCQTLNSIYKNEKREFYLYKIVDSGKFYGVHFVFSGKQTKVQFENNPVLQNYIEQFIPTEKANSKPLHIQKILKLYRKDSIFIVKPKAVKYWLNTIALRDADETFIDLIKTGL